MRYLLDVNALIAAHHADSPLHAQFHQWAKTVSSADMATCAMVELGFLRVSMQVFRYTADQAVGALAATKEQMGFVPTAPSPVLPAWANTGAKTTDAYLQQVAESAGLKLATFDRGIPGAVKIA
ncbi:MAG: hypothetical protein RLZZ50_1284 [Verrucomicrobiota bacterium]|jgi:predicted nucleic acid-binding protein